LCEGQRAPGASPYQWTDTQKSPNFGWQGLVWEVFFFFWIFYVIEWVLAGLGLVTQFARMV
jgi:hypothetical protein